MTRIRKEEGTTVFEDADGNLHTQEPRILALINELEADCDSMPDGWVQFEVSYIRGIIKKLKEFL